MVEKNAPPQADEVKEVAVNREVVVNHEVVVKKSKISMVWIVPLVVLVLGATIVYKTLRDAGVPIVVTFETADGLEAGKTKIRYKDVDIGLVDAIRVSDDATHVILDATLDRHAEKYLLETTRFWVVRPSVTLQGITGLGTLLSGAYINIDPGTGQPTREYEGMEIPPVLSLGSDARQFVLHAEELGSVNVGSPIIYRGFKVGEVLSYGMMDDDRAVEIKFFVREPHHDLVFTESKFWDVSGMDVQASADGFDVKIASMTSLLTGGIAFETSKRITNRVTAEEHTVFQLHRRHSDIDYFEKSKNAVRFHFDDTLRGLSVGAPVEYRGIKVGEVSDISVDFDPETLEIKLPVTAMIEPERFGGVEANETERAERLTRFIELGMRGQLKSGSLITGALFVDLVMEPDTPIRLVSGPDYEIQEIPTIRSTSEQILSSVEDVVVKLDRLMTRIDKLEIEKLFNHATGATEELEKLVASVDITETVKSVNDLLDSARPVMNNLERLIVGADRALVEIRPQIADIFEQAEATFADLNTLLAADSPTQTDVRAMLKEIAEMARSFRNLTTYLERHPEALLKGKSGN